MNEIIEKEKGPRGGEVFKKNNQEKEELKLAKSNHKKLLKARNNGSKA
jgi:hypothetical protein